MAKRGGHLREERRLGCSCFLLGIFPLFSHSPPRLTGDQIRAGGGARAGTKPGPPGEPPAGAGFPEPPGERGLQPAPGEPAPRALPPRSFSLPLPLPPSRAGRAPGLSPLAALPPPAPCSLLPPRGRGAAVPAGGRAPCRGRGRGWRGGAEGCAPLLPAPN